MSISEAFSDNLFPHALDLDSHEFIPSHLYEQFFGEAGAQVKEIISTRRNEGGERRENDLNRPDVTGDVTPIDPENIWHLKGPDAPGAIDMHRRLEVLDVMGIDAQLVFPSFGTWALSLATLSDEGFATKFTIERPPNHRQIGLDAIRAHNDWILSLGDLQDRQRHVAIIPTFNFDDMIRETERVLDGGIQAVCIPAGIPPAGTSPANPRLDPFWALAAERNVPVILHIDTDPFLPLEWWDAPAFRRQADSVLPLGTYFMTTYVFAIENFVASMVIGGVFERHPTLRFGVIECGAPWLGPLCERMEMAWDFFGRTRNMERRPTQYLSDQVRVTPFFFEPVDLYLERYPQLADVYCFSSDYPHSEGGVDAMRTFFTRVEPFGREALTKFFRTNAQLLMPS